MQAAQVYFLTKILSSYTSIFYLELLVWMIVTFNVMMPFHTFSLLAYLRNILNFIYSNNIQPSSADIAWQVFVQAVHSVMSQWTVLGLAVTQEWGGSNSKSKAEKMVQCILDVFEDVKLGRGLKLITRF